MLGTIITTIFTIFGSVGIGRIQDTETGYRDYVVAIATPEGNMGSGFNYRGFIVTAAHVCGHAKEASVSRTRLSRRETSKVLRTIQATDLCVLSRISENMPRELHLRYSPLREHEIAYAIGFPGLQTQPTMVRLESMDASMGFTMASGSRTVDIYRGLVTGGMSGGPAFDSNGFLIGMNDIVNPSQFFSGLAELTTLDSVIDDILAVK